jgi:hypothetical protein
MLRRGLSSAASRTPKVTLNTMAEPGLTASRSKVAMSNLRKALLEMSLDELQHAHNIGEREVAKISTYIVQAVKSYETSRSLLEDIATELAHRYDVIEKTASKAIAKAKEST